MPDSRRHRPAPCHRLLGRVQGAGRLGVAVEELDRPPFHAQARHTAGLIVMQRLPKNSLSRRIVVNALKIAVVGTLLNLANQAEVMLHGDTIAGLHLILNYLVP